MQIYVQTYEPFLPKHKIEDSTHYSKRYPTNCQ